MYSDDLADDIYITDVSIQLRRPTLGVWNTETDEFYLGDERIDLYVTGTLQIGAGSPMPETYLVTNTDAIFGRIGAGGEIEILGVSAQDSEFEIAADLDYDTPAGSPPKAEYGLDSTVTAPSAAGLPIPSIEDGSWDPDNDIARKTWFVDGVERSAAYVIPAGTHTIGLWVHDSRDALDYRESVVSVLSP